MQISIERLMHLGISQARATELNEQIKKLAHLTNSAIWHEISQKVLYQYPFNIHLLLFSILFPDWHLNPDSAFAWVPAQDFIKTTNIYQFMSENDFDDVPAFHAWTHQSYEAFWQKIINKLNIRFKKHPEAIGDLSLGLESPQWLPGAELNIVDSCLCASSEKIALIYQNHQGEIEKMTYGTLSKLTNRVANGLIKAGLKQGDRIAIIMPMHYEAVAIYLGIIKIGGIVVSIADSFSSQEMSTRLNLSATKAIFTQDFTVWTDKKIPLYEKVLAIDTTASIFLICTESQNHLKLRSQDCLWETFLSEKDVFNSIACQPMDACNILFSSGTTAEPKAIPWNHTTAIKVASDAFFHQNIKINDILAWPTNLGWMMGPWLLFAGLIHQAAIALYTKAPKDVAFGKFIQDAGVTMLGVVPTLVAEWRQSHCMEQLNWRSIQKFSSTGECSNAEDMLYLMSLAGYKPVIEYCGGTEIGGAYVSSTMIQTNCPSLFSTPAMGLDFTIVDDNGMPSDIGEVAIIPPSIGLSTQLINADHHTVYFANMPKQDKLLRRHGDSIKRFPNHYYAVLGRVDDTMNLGGIKISAAEIERAIKDEPSIIETAAVAIPSSGQGPNLLIIFVVTQAAIDKNETKSSMQKKINSRLNPLFKIYDLVLLKELPKTASNKIMRRVLRKKYEEEL